MTPQSSSMMPADNSLESTDLNTLVRRYLRAWPLLLVSFALLFGIAILLVVVVPPYHTGAMSILIETPMRYDDPNRMVQPQQRSETTAKNYYINEKLLVTSQPVLRKVVDRLGLAIQYLEKGLIDRDLYKTSPIVLQVDSASLPGPAHFPRNVPFYVDVIDDQVFHLEGEGKYGPDELEIAVDRQEHWGEWFWLDSLKLRVVLKPGTMRDLETLKEKTYGFKLRDPAEVTLDLLGSVGSELTESEASTVLVQLTGTPAQRVLDVLNAIGDTYMEHHMNERITTLDRTIRNMEEEIRRNTMALDDRSDSLEAFRTSAGVTHMNEETVLLLEQTADLERERQELMVKGQYYLYLRDLLGKGTKSDKPMSPKAFGIQDEILNEMTEKLVALQTDIALLEQENKTANPNYQRLVRQAEQQRQNILGSVEGFKTSNDLRLANLNQRYERMVGQQSAIPRTERALMDKERDQRVLEALYTDLALRRANLRVMRQGLEPEVKVTTPAYITDTEPVFPNLKILLVVAVLLGALLPLFYVAFKGLFSNKIRGARDLGAVLPDARLVAQLPYTAITDAGELAAYPRSMTYTEVARLAMVVEVEGAQPTLVSAAGNREGARSVSTLLAAMLALRGHKTLLVHADGTTGVQHGAMPRRSPTEKLDVLEAGDVMAVANAKPGWAGYDHIVLHGPDAGLLATRPDLLRSAGRLLVVCEPSRTTRATLEDLARARANGQLPDLAIVLNRTLDRPLPFFGLGRGRGEKRLGIRRALCYNWARAV